MSAIKRAGRIDLEFLTNAVTEEPSARRQSSLDQPSLVSLWKEVSSFIGSQLLLNRSVFLPCIGHFYVKRRGTKDSIKLLFVPSHNWDQLPGFRIPRNAVQGVAPSDNLNYSAVAQEGGKFSRDEVETGYKDLTHIFMFQLRTRSNDSYHLTFPKLGDLSVQNRRVQFKFDDELTQQIELLEKTSKKDSFSSKSSDRANSPYTIASPPSSETRGTTSTTASTSAVSGGAASSTSSESKLSDSCSSSDTNSSGKKVVFDSSVTGHEDGSVNDTDTTENITTNYSSASTLISVRGQGMLEPLATAAAPSYPALRSKPEDFNINKLIPGYAELVSRSPEDDEDLDFIYGLISFKDFHTHPFSGDRLWSNIKCPICRQHGIPVIDYKDDLKKKEIEQDRLLLKLSLDVDSEFLKKKKDLEDERNRELHMISQYNLTRAEERKSKLLSQSGPMPMGDLFENRPNPPDKRLINERNASAVIEQIQKRKNAHEVEEAQKELEDRILNRKFVQKFRKEETENAMGKLVRQKKLREDLSKQVYEKNHKEPIPNPEVEKTFATDEKPLFEHQKERAKKLYQEQMNLLQQKREYEARVAEIQLQSQLDRLALGKIRLNNDLDKVKRLKYQARKSLEEYWSQQVQFRKANLNPYDPEA